VGCSADTCTEEDTMTTLTDNDWDNLAQAELATADGPASAETLCRVATAYDDIGFPDVALAVLRKAGSFGIENRAVLPALLRGHRKQRQFVELNAAVQAGVTVNERDTDLRRELALALSSLGQTPAAEAEWASLIRSGCMTETDWLGCARFVMSCADAPSLAQMMKVIGEREELKTNHLAGYCAVKHLIDRDVVATQLALREVDPSRIYDPDILLDLAILAWRLQDYARADTAARLAATPADAPPVCKTVLASIRSFAGDFSLTRRVSMPMAGEIAERVLKLALTVKPDAAAWGFLHRHGSNSFGARILDLTAEPDMDVPEDLDPVATFSILSYGLCPDPFQVLCGVDWSWPHIMVQRIPDGSALHFFGEAHGHKDWLWEEVRAEGCGAEVAQACAPRHQQSATWVEALRELSERADDKP
jgi:hypothetical protein